MNTNISEETTPTEDQKQQSKQPSKSIVSENSSSTGGDFMSDWKSFAAKATSSFNEASQSISETLRESGVNDVVASTTTNVKFYANSAYDMSANAASNAAEFTTNAAKDTMSALQSLDRERIAWSMAFTFVSGLSLTLAFTVGIARLRCSQPNSLCASLCFLFQTFAPSARCEGERTNQTHVRSGTTIRLYGFLGTILFLWAALIKHSYFLTVMASVAQALALLYYQLSFFPMGAEGFRVVCVAYATGVNQRERRPFEEWFYRPAVV